MKVQFHSLLHRRAVWIAAAAWVLAAMLAASAAAQETAQQHAQRGVDLAQSGNLSGAEVELRRAAQVDPRDAHVLGNLGTVLAMEGKLEDSTRFLQQAVKLEPGAMVLRQYLAANLWQLHRSAEAKPQLEIILKAQPQNTQAIFLLGMVSENLKDYAAAAGLLASVPELVRQHPESVAALALSQYKTGEMEEARKTFAVFLDHPDAARAALMGAGIASDAGDYKEALYLLEPAEASNPSFPGLAYNVALALYHLGRYADCETKLQALIQNGRDSADTENLLGWCYEKQGKHEPAVAALQKAIALDPKMEPNFLDLASILRALGSLPMALSVAEQGARSFSDSARMWSLKGSIELRMSHYPDAIRSFSRAYQLDPGNADALRGWGKAYEGRGATAQATQTFEEGIRKFPRDARFDLEYAVLLLRRADLGDKAAKPHAVELLHKAVELDPASAEAHYQLGNLALKGGRLKEALDELQKAARFDPDASKIHFALARACQALGQKEAAAREMADFQKLKEQEQSIAYSAPAGMGSH